MGINVEKVYADFIANTRQVFKFPLIDDNGMQIDVNTVVDIEWRASNYGNKIAKIEKSLGEGIEVDNGIALVTLNSQDTHSLFGKFHHQFAVFYSNFEKTVTKEGYFLIRKEME